jgi:hypothetical protein
MAAPDGAGIGASTDGSADNSSQQAGNADDLTKAFNAGADGQKPTDKPSDGDKSSGGKDPGSEKKLAPWADQLPPELRDNPEMASKLAKFGKLGEMAKAYLELEGKAGGVVIPGQDATAEAVAQFWEKAGRPKAADGYSFASDKESEGDIFAQAAFAANLTESQAAALLKNFQAIGESKQQAFQESLKQKQAQTAAELQKEYGSRYAENMEYLTRGLAAAGKNVAQLLYNAGLAGELDIVKAFITYGKMTAESGSNRGDGAGDSMKSIMDGGTFDYKD